MGTGPFAVPAFDALRQCGHEIALVVTRPVIVTKSRKGPPPSPVREFALSHGFEIFDPESINTPESVAMLAGQRAALLVVCDYGQILSREALATTPMGGINLHGSLLPAYRGAAPVQWAVIHGDQVAGVSIIHMTPRLDGGPILATAEIDVDPTDTAGSLESKLSRLGVEPTVESVELLAAWDQTSPIGVPQDASKISRAPRLSKASGEIDWTRTAVEIDCHVRGMHPWPGAFTDVRVAGDKPLVRVAVRHVTMVAPAQPIVFPPGVIADESAMVITTGPVDSSGNATGMVRIERLQPAGRNEMTGTEFIRGHRLKCGTSLV